MKQKIKCIALLLIAITTGCQTNTKPKGFDYGKVENNVYHNSFFNFNLTLPPEWIVQSKEQNENMAKMGQDLVAGDDENLKTIIKASEVNSAYLLTIFKYEVGSAVKYNPGLVLVAENLKTAPGIKTGSDYLFHTRKLLKQSQLQYNSIDDKFEKVVFDNQEFHRMNLDMNYSGLSIKQSYYATIKNDFSVCAIISYGTDEQKKELEEILDSLDFE